MLLPTSWLDLAGFRLYSADWIVKDIFESVFKRTCWFDCWCIAPVGCSVGCGITG